MSEQPDDSDAVPVPAALLDLLVRYAAAELARQARVDGGYLAPDAAAARLLTEVTAARQTVHTRQSAVDGDHRPDEVSVPEAALLLGISERAVRKRIAAGTLPARRVGGRWLVGRGAVPEPEPS